MKKEERLLLERERVANMRLFEKEQAEKVLGYTPAFLCGVDEVGRGPLAGPVAAGACILPSDIEDLPLVNDSKKLSEKKREELFAEIDRAAVCWAVAFVSPEEIDRINILQATYEAMRKAIALLPISPEIVVADAVTIPDLACPQTGIVKADASCLSVAAASILAKVTRDRYMDGMDAVYPAYGFIRNKGYGTKEHINALVQVGPSPLHRRSFIKNILQ